MLRRGVLFGLVAVAASGTGFVVRAADLSSGDYLAVALTFDDGPHPYLTPRLLDILERERVRATFYVIGAYAARYPDIVQRAFRSGHEIGNHSWSHPLLTRVSLARAAKEIDRTDELLQGLTGEKPNTVRPPYGALDQAVEALAEPRPMMLWNVDTLDWRTRNTAAVERAAIRGGGGIVLMHDIHPTTVAAVPEIIRHYKANGFQFVTVSAYVEWDTRNGGLWANVG